MVQRSAEVCLFLELCTVSQYADLSLAPEADRTLWGQWRAAYDGDPVADYPLAALTPEFGRIAGITLGFFRGAEFRLTSWVGQERDVLSKFLRVLDSLARRSPGLKLCAHNGREFDFPFLSKRLVVHGFILPPMLELAGVKPWRAPNIDTLELWHFGGRRQYVGLEVIAHTLGLDLRYEWVPGGEMHRLFYAGDYDAIGRQGQLEVYVTAQLLRRLRGQTLFAPGDVRWGEIHHLVPGSET